MWRTWHCRLVMAEDVVVHFWKIQVIIKRNEKSAIVVYHFSDGIDHCHISFLQQHLWNTDVIGTETVERAVPYGSKEVLGFPALGPGFLRAGCFSWSTSATGLPVMEQRSFGIWCHLVYSWSYSRWLIKSVQIGCGHYMLTALLSKINSCCKTSLDIFGTMPALLFFAAPPMQK